MAFCACIDKDGFWAQNPKSRESILAQLPEIATFYRDEQIVLEESQDERVLCLSQFVWNCCKNGYPVFESNMEAIKDSGWMHRLFYWETGKFGHLVKVWKHTQNSCVFLFTYNNHFHEEFVSKGIRTRHPTQGQTPERQDCQFPGFRTHTRLCN